MRIVQSGHGAPYELSEIHDGYLCGIDVSNENELKIAFRTIEGGSWRLTIGRLMALKADNFRQGNIVDGVYFFTGDACPHEYLCQAYGYKEDECQKYLSIRLKELAPYPWTLIMILNTYGCDLFAVSSNSISDFVISRR